MVTFAPFAIFIGAAAAVVLAFFAFWDSIQQYVARTFGRFGSLFDRAGTKRKPEEFVATWTTLTAAIWIVALLLLKPSLIIGLLMLPLAALMAGGLYAAYVQFALRRRTEKFINQLEVVLRLMASGLRSGLGLQQSLRLVVAETPDPARYEYSRVLGQANIGVSIYDALDDLAARMERNEPLMMARVIRIQSQTGGDLARVLEQLANTIKERRRMRRKIRSLTAEGRAGALVIAALPPFLGMFIVASQPLMGHALVYTTAGHITLAIVLILEALGVFALSMILKVKV